MCLDLGLLAFNHRQVCANWVWGGCQYSILWIDLPCTGNVVKGKQCSWWLHGRLKIWQWSSQSLWMYNRLCRVCAVMENWRIPGGYLCLWSKRRNFNGVGRLEEIVIRWSETNKQRSTIKWSKNGPSLLSFSPVKHGNWIILNALIQSCIWERDAQECWHHCLFVFVREVKWTD